MLPGLVLTRLIFVVDSCSGPSRIPHGRGTGPCLLAGLQTLPCSQKILSAQCRTPADQENAGIVIPCSAQIHPSQSCHGLFLSFPLCLLLALGGNGSNIKMKSVHSWLCELGQFRCSWEDWEHLAEEAQGCFHAVLMVPQSSCRASARPQLPSTEQPPGEQPFPNPHNLQLCISLGKGLL